MSRANVAVHVSKGRVPFNEARILAAELRALLRPYCERLEIAGSLRRKVGAVGDIELVVVPKMGAEPMLFAELEAPARDLLADRIKELCAAGRLELGKPGDGASGRFGPRYKCLVYKGVQVDVFEVLPPASWGVQLLLRTGPADFSKRLVMQRRAGGLCPAGVRFYGGHLERFYPWGDGQRRELIGDGFVCVDGKAVELGDWLPLDTPEEEDALRELALPWIEPAARR